MFPIKSFLFLVLLEITTGTSNEMIYACPGSRANLSCVIDTPGSIIQWSIWCECGGDSSGSCQDTCSSQQPTTILHTESRILNGSLCGSTADDSAITYKHSFTVIRDEENETLVPSSNLTIAVPLVLPPQSSSTLCFVCRSQASRYVQILEPPTTPKNFTFYPDYTTATGTDIEVNLSWTPSLDSAERSVVYVIAISHEASASTGTRHYTTSSSFTARLRFNTTYNVSIHASRCNDVLTSDPLISSITINKDPQCVTPSVPPDVRINTIVAGSLISYQCGEGLVPEGNEEARCGPEGVWIPNPALHVCSNTSMPTTTARNQETTVTISIVYLAVITALVSVTVLILIVVAFCLGALLGIYKTKKKAVSTTIPAAQYETVNLAVGEPATAVEKLHHYEDITLRDKSDVDTLTSNVAYGYTKN